MTHVTCRLTAKYRVQLRNPVRLVIEYGLPLPFKSPLACLLSLAGEQLERKLAVESERAYHSRDRASYAPDCTLAMTSVRQQTSLLGSTLDRFDALHRESMIEIIWKRQLSELEQAMKTVRQAPIIIIIIIFYTPVSKDPRC